MRVIVGQPRATQRRHLKTPDDEAALTADIVRLATQYGRYGYRRIRAMLVAEGWRVKTLYIEPRSPWENGSCESLNSKLRDELPNGEIFTTLQEAEVLIENWRRHYNAVRPHSSLNYRPPAPEAILPPASGLPYAPLRPAQMRADDGRVLT